MLTVKDERVKAILAFSLMGFCHSYCDSRRRPVGAIRYNIYITESTKT